MSGAENLMFILGGVVGIKDAVYHKAVVPLG